MARVKPAFDGGYINPSASLLHNNTATLTTIGQFYNDFELGTNTGLIGWLTLTEYINKIKHTLLDILVLFNLHVYSVTVSL